MQAIVACLRALLLVSAVCAIPLSSLVAAAPAAYGAGDGDSLTQLAVSGTTLKGTVTADLADTSIVVYILGGTHAPPRHALPRTAAAVGAVARRRGRRAIAACGGGSA